MGKRAPVVILFFGLIDEVELVAPSPEYNCCVHVLDRSRSLAAKENGTNWSSAGPSSSQGLATLARVYVSPPRRLELYGLEERLVIVHEQ